MPSADSSWPSIRRYPSAASRAWAESRCDRAAPRPGGKAPPAGAARGGDAAPAATADAGPRYGPIPTALGPLPTGIGVPTTVLVDVSITVTLLLPKLAT